MNLKEQLKQALAAMGTMLDEADKNGGVMDEAATAKYAGLQKEASDLTAAIERRDQLDATNTQLSQALPRQTEHNDPAPLPTEGLTVTPGAVDPTGGFQSIAEFARCVHTASGRGGYVDERLMVDAAAPSSPHKEVGTTEGFMVQPAHREEIWELVMNEPDIMQLVEFEPTDSNRVELAADEDTPWAATGVQAKWANEVSQFSESKLSTEPRSVPLHKLYAFVTASEELLMDAPRLQSRLSTRSAQAISWRASQAIVEGTGAGQPLGFKTSAALVSVAKESGQAAATLVSENVANMFARMWPAGLGSAVWIINPDVFPQLITMTIGDRVIWTPPQTGFAGAPGGFLFGRPIILSQHSETLGDQGDIYFVDPKGYYGTNKASGIKADSSIHLYFDYDVTAFRWTFRIGGMPFLSAPIVPNKGSNDQSHFVTLDERA